MGEPANPRRVTVKCVAVRWVSDEPQPGWVEYQMTDADGATWSFFDKPIHGGWEAMTPMANYPLPSSFDCEIMRTETDAQGDALIVISTLNPNGLETSDGRCEFRVRQSQIAVDADEVLDEVRPRWDSGELRLD